MTRTPIQILDQLVADGIIDSHASVESRVNFIATFSDGVTVRASNLTLADAEDDRLSYMQIAASHGQSIEFEILDRCGDCAHCAHPIAAHDDGRCCFVERDAAADCGCTSTS